MNELLWLPSSPSGFGTKAMLGSNSMLTESELSMPSLRRIDSIYCLDEIAIESGFVVISMSTIFVGLPMLVTSYLASMSVIVLSLSSIDIVNISISSTHTVTMEKSSPMRHMYMQGLESKCLYFLFVSLELNSMFHSCLACFRPYNVFINLPILLVLLSKPSGCFMYCYAQTLHIVNTRLE